MCDYTDLAASKNDAPFEESWGFPNDVIREIPMAIGFDIVTTGSTFRSGRSRFDCRIYGPARVVLETRDAMELISKKTGQPYHVVSKKQRRPAARASPLT